MRESAAARQDDLGDLARQIASQLKGDPRGPTENVLRPARVVVAQ